MNAERRPLAPATRGRITHAAPLAPLTWFKTGGVAELLFEPADADDLAHFLTDLAPRCPVFALGLGSNLIVRDGGIAGVTVRLGKPFAGIAIEGDRVRAGAGAPGIAVASAARDSGLAGLEFLRGIPGTIGGAVRMNAGAYGRDLSDLLVEATVVTRDGAVAVWPAARLGYSYRHSALPDGAVVVEAVLRGVPGERAAIAAEMDRIAAEREVSLSSGRGVAAACEALGHRVVAIDMDRDVATKLARAAPDVVFNALHGTPGEDGSVQGMLDLMGLPYTHSGLATSVIAIDKELTKQALVPHGIRMPAGTMVASESLYAGDPLPRPYVLKPVNEGSSVGVAIVADGGNHGSPIGRDSEGPWRVFDRLLAEPFVPGRELTVAVLGDRALAVTELVIDGGFYDYAHKYTDGVTTHLCPAPIPADIAAAAMRMAADAHRLLGCRGCSRSDFRWDESRGEAGLYLLEVNTQPGMTPLSLVPEQARAVGMSYEALVQALLDEALARAGRAAG